MIKSLKFYIPAIVCAIVILYLSAFPGPQLMNVNWFQPDKVAHIIAYLGLSLTLGWGYLKQNQQVTKKAFLMLLIIGSAYGILMEIMQYLFFPNRYFDVGDMIANIIGSFFGLLLIRFYCLQIK